MILIYYHSINTDKLFSPNENNVIISRDVKFDLRKVKTGTDTKL